MPAWDLQILNHVNHGWSHPLLDWLMPAASAISAWVPLLVVVALLIFWRGGKQGRLMLLCIGLAVGIGDGLVSNTLKKTVGRVRPRDAVAGLVVRDLGPGKPEWKRLFATPEISASKVRRDERGNSFPSSHTVNMFALATVVACFYRRWGLLAYGVAALVACSRLYVVAHWPSDLPPSMAIGLLVGWGTVQGVAWVRRRWAGSAAG